MIITIKNLQQQTFTVEFDAEKTVFELKEVIFKNRGGDYNIEKQKLIYAGIILEDERTIASYNVDEKKFVVVMLKRDVGTAEKEKEKEKEKERERDSKSNKPESPKSELEEPTVEPTKSDAEKVEEKKASDKSSEPATSTESETSNIVLQTQAESNLLMGEEYNRSVDYLIEMGYSREMVERAMAASYNNPDRAVEYLISGIPDVDSGFGTEQETRNAGGNAGSAGNTDRSDQSANESSSRDPFEFLRDQPQFLQMRSLVYQNPDLLHAVLQQIGQTNPALLQLISENQDAFLNMLNQPVEGQEQNSTSQRHSSPERRAQLSALSLSVNPTRSAAPDQQAGRGGGNRVRNLNTPGADRTITQHMPENAGDDGEGPAVIRLTQAEQDAIERLKAMGFPEALVLQAYFACDKDEQLAANFLVSSAFED